MDDGSSTSVKCFALSGVGVSILRLVRYAALRLVPAKIVHPRLWMIFAYFINRQCGEFDRWVGFSKRCAWRWRWAGTGSHNQHQTGTR